ncbi:MAG: hypothetical protein L6V86_08520 [Treponema sp.]|nr:MAG: hypothetical protein L6V86_08520 [Treponema sp.]
MFKTKKWTSFFAGIKTVGVLYPPKIQISKRTAYSPWEIVWTSFSKAGNDLQFAISAITNETKNPTNTKNS